MTMTVVIIIMIVLLTAFSDSFLNIRHLILIRIFSTPLWLGCWKRGPAMAGETRGHGSSACEKARRLFDAVWERKEVFYDSRWFLCRNVYMQIHTHVCAIPPVTVAHDSLRYMPKSGAAWDTKGVIKQIITKISSSSIFFNFGDYDRFLEILDIPIDKSSLW